MERNKEGSGKVGRRMVGKEWGIRKAVGNEIFIKEDGNDGKPKQWKGKRQKRRVNKGIKKGNKSRDKIIRLTGCFRLPERKRAKGLK